MWKEHKFGSLEFECLLQNSFWNLIVVIKVLKDRSFKVRLGQKESVLMGEINAVINA
jgi:hypothetical protein